MYKADQARRDNFYSEVYISLVEKKFPNIYACVTDPATQAAIIGEISTKARQVKKEKGIDLLTPLELLAMVAYWQVIDQISYENEKQGTRNMTPYLATIIHLDGNKGIEPGLVQKTQLMMAQIVGGKLLPRN